MGGKEGLISGEGDLEFPLNLFFRSSTDVFLSIFLPDSGLTLADGFTNGGANLWRGLVMGEGPVVDEEKADPPEPSPFPLASVLVSNCFIRFEIRETLGPLLDSGGLFTDALVTFCCPGVCMRVGFGDE